MTKPIPPATLERLTAANDFVLADAQAERDPKDTIAALVATHGAISRQRSGTYELRCATVIGSSTCGAPGAILRSWRRNAMVRIMGASHG